MLVIAVPSGLTKIERDRRVVKLAFLMSQNINVVKKAGSEGYTANSDYSAWVEAGMDSIVLDMTPENINLLASQFKNMAFVVQEDGCVAILKANQV